MLKGPSHLSVLILEQDEQIGMGIVEQIQRETPYQALLVTSPHQAHHLLRQVAGECVMLADDTFPPGDGDRFPQEVRPGAERHRTFLFSTYHLVGGRDLKSVVKAVKLLLSVQDVL